MWPCAACPWASGPSSTSNGVSPSPCSRSWPGPRRGGGARSRRGRGPRRASWTCAAPSVRARKSRVRVVLRVVDDLLGRADLDEHALLDEVDAVRGLAGERHLVGDHDHRRALVGQLLHDVEHLADERRVEGRRGLVEQQDLGLHRERPGDRDALLLAAGQARRVLVALLGQAHLVEVLLGRRDRLRPGHALHADGPLDQVVDDLEVREQVELLEHHLGAQPHLPDLLPVAAVARVQRLGHRAAARRPRSPPSWAPRGS